jgi:hypothetical protein
MGRRSRQFVLPIATIAARFNMRRGRPQSLAQSVDILYTVRELPMLSVCL